MPFRRTDTHPKVRRTAVYTLKNGEKWHRYERPDGKWVEICVKVARSQPQMAASIARSRAVGKLYRCRCHG